MGDSDIGRTVYDGYITCNLSVISLYIKRLWEEEASKLIICVWRHDTWSDVTTRGLTSRIVVWCHVTWPDVSDTWSDVTPRGMSQSWWMFLQPSTYCGGVHYVGFNVEFSASRTWCLILPPRILSDCTIYSYCSKMDRWMDKHYQNSIYTSCQQFSLP